MSQLRIGLPSTRKRLKCTLSGAIRYAIRSCSKTISKVDHPDVPVLFGDVWTGHPDIRMSLRMRSAVSFDLKAVFFFSQASKTFFRSFLVL